VTRNFKGGVAFANMHPSCAQVDALAGAQYGIDAIQDKRLDLLENRSSSLESLLKPGHESLEKRGDRDSNGAHVRVQPWGKGLWKVFARRLG